MAVSTMPKLIAALILLAVILSTVGQGPPPDDDEGGPPGPPEPPGPQDDDGPTSSSTELSPVCDNRGADAHYDVYFRCVRPDVSDRRLTCVTLHQDLVLLKLA